LIFEVRDPSPGDSGASDKRRLIIESEFAQILKVLAREGNTLSPVVRNAWDGKPLQTIAKNAPVRATGAHIAIIGHITKDELLRFVSGTELANGFVNRFPLIGVRRSQELPFGGRLQGEQLERVREATLAALRFASLPRQLSFDPSEPEAYRRDVPKAEVHIVDGGHFDLWGKHAEDVVSLFGEFTVTVGVSVDEDGVRAHLGRGAQRHGGMHSEFSRFVGSRGDDSAFVALSTNDYGFAFQRRIVELFHGDEESVHVDVEDGAGDGGLGRGGHASGNFNSSALTWLRPTRSKP